MDGADLVRDAVHHGGIDAEPTVAGERFAGQLEQHSPIFHRVLRLRHGRSSLGITRHSLAQGYLPSWKRAKRATSTRSPVRADTSVTRSLMVRSGSLTNACSMSALSWKNFFIFPSTMRARMFSGLP